MRLLLLLAAGLILAGCSATQLAATQTKINADIAASQPTVSMLCWGISAADAVFKATYAVGPQADAAVVADEAKAVAASGPICAAPPANTAQAVASLAATYKAIQTATPAAVAAPVAVAPAAAVP